MGSNIKFEMEYGSQGILFYKETFEASKPY